MVNQKAWLKQYIDLNTELRKNTNNNSVFGKTIEIPEVIGI